MNERISKISKMNKITTHVANEPEILHIDMTSADALSSSWLPRYAEKSTLLLQLVVVISSVLSEWSALSIESFSEPEETDWLPIDDDTNAVVFIGNRLKRSGTDLLLLLLVFLLLWMMGNKRPFGQILAEPEIFIDTDNAV